ncbi:MAG: peptidase S10 [Planctomycetes bacterium]|nr:peptidase S10 [Planctomycetota bacterium]
MAPAQDAPTSRPAASAAAPAAVAEAAADQSAAVTSHTLELGGQTLRYTATAGKLPILHDGEKVKAEVFYVAYRLEGGADDRPLTFAFNGGPGSSSVWLHLGALGPQRVLMGDEGQAPQVPTRYGPNHASWLDLTDLVFIDPVSTGYSRAAEGESPKQFHGLDEDAAAVGEFIRLYVTRNKRWSAPKFLVGESYGTTRAAALAGHLQGRWGMNLNGVVLVSPVLDFQTIRFAPGNDQPYWLFLPTYAATAAYHGKLQTNDLPATLREVEAWAQSEYLTALALGDRLPPAREAAVVQTLARYTGLSETFVRRSGLRISMQAFAKELLRDQSYTVGRFDGRYLGRDRLDAGDSPDYDPSYAVVQGAYSAALNDYVRAELGFETDRPYEILTGAVNPWNYSWAGTNRFVNVAQTLRDAIAKNPGLHVLVATGTYDLATPYFAADYTVAHLGLPPELRDHVQTTRYGAGHMMYLRKPDLEQLKSDAAAFYGRALGR